MNIHKTLREKFRPALALGLAACLVGGVSGAATAAPDTLANAEVSAQALTAVESSLQPIVGSWHEEDVLDARTLTIYADGKYELIYKGGGKAFGKVKVTPEEHPDGSKSLWYSFYEEGGLTLEDKDTANPWYSVYKTAFQLWAAFPKDEKAETQTTLLSGQDGAMRFVRNEENNYHATSKGVKAEDYLGVWACGRCNATVSRQGAGYLVEIQWANSAAEGSLWSYPCSYDNYSGILFSNDDGTRTDYIYTEDGSVTNKMVYNDGHGVFVLRNGRMTWQDNKENAGDGIGFIK